MAVNGLKIITIVGAESSGKSTLCRRLAEYFDCPWVPEYAREYLESINRSYDLDDLEVIAERQIKIIESEIERFESGSGRFDLSGGGLDCAQRPEEIKDAKDRFDCDQRPGDFKDAKDRFDCAQRPAALEGDNELVAAIKSKIPNLKSKILFLDGGMLNLRMWAKIKYGVTIPAVEKRMMNDQTDLYILCRPLNTWSEDPLREAPKLLDRSWIYNLYLYELQKNKLPYIIGT